jgi:hypothetical protein
MKAGWERAWVLAGMLVVLFAGGELAAEPGAGHGSAHAECVYLLDGREGSSRRVNLSAVTEQAAAALAGPGRSRSARQEPAPDNFIDGYIFGTLRRLNITPAGPASDEEFLRRVTLDLTGRIPTAESLLEFLSDPHPDKRARAIERLLASSAWADRWAAFFGDLYRNTVATPHLTRYQEGRDAFHYYLVDSLRQGKPYATMVRELIGDSGNSWEAGQVNFTLGGHTTGGPVQDTFDTQAVNVATAFLGISHVDCILCHDGERRLDSVSLWGARAKRADAYGMAAFFARTSLTQPLARLWVVMESGSGNYNLGTASGNRPPRRPVAGQTSVLPKYLFGGGQPEPGESWRAALARFVTGDLQFARATVNYIWREFMVVGLVEPPDQFDPLRLDPLNPPPAPWTLQPSNPQLLNDLARSFIQSGYDLKALMRAISNSRAYQLSARYPGPWNAEWERYYARKLVRRLRAEEIHDAVVISSGVGGGYVIPGFRVPRVDFAMQLPDVAGMPGGTAGDLLDSFLRGNRYDDDRRGDVTILQALRLMNSDFVHNRVRNVTGTLLSRVVNLPDPALIEQLYLNVLSRHPTPEEQEKAGRWLASGNRAAKAEDLLWSLYNKVDFVFSY